MYSQLQCLTLAAGLVSLSRYFDGTCDSKAAAASFKVGHVITRKHCFCQAAADLCGAA